jgi:hypothetical protein
MATRWSQGQRIGKNVGKIRPISVTYLEPREDFKATLVEFWDRVKRTLGIVERLLLLQEFAERLVIVSPRRRYSQVRRGSFKRRVGGQCWACHGGAAEHRHHIVQVQHGGLNRAANCVCLCKGCHAVVHPWMRKKVASMGS